MIKDEIENKLNDDLNPWFLDVINESPNHNVPDGAESHFKIVIVSEKFLDFRAVKRHQLIYKSLENVMNKIHALSIYAFDLDEIEKNPSVIDSPDCANK